MEQQAFILTTAMVIIAIVTFITSFILTMG